MPTQEERLAALETDTKAAVPDINHNITMLKGVIGSQGQDIKRIFQRVDSMDGRLSVMDGRLNILDGRLNFLDGRLATVEQDTTQIKETLNEHTILLTKILERLPGKP
ncbi:MAG TPA: hypothetical protein VGM01_05670 [Ktedonobacteraceae bacterium]